MKKLTLLFLALAPLVSAMSAAVVEAGYRFSLDFTAPPSAVQLEDVNGRRLGVDFGKSIDQVGRQGSQFSGLKEIPNSTVEQENLADDDGPDFGAPSTKTFWNLEVKKLTSKTSYKLHLVGLNNGLGEIAISLRKGIGSKGMMSADLNCFVEKGKRLEMNITLDPTTGKFETKRIVDSGKFLSDLVRACERKDIAPEAACIVLRRLVKVIDSKSEKIEEKRFALKLFVQILDRLRNFGSKGNRDWNDVKGDPRCKEFANDDFGSKHFAKSPSYEILREEALVLLETCGDDKEGDRHEEKRR
jgi:hypothetical protein